MVGPILWLAASGHLSLMMLPDWSARDIQGFEIAPLGPFQGKNFATTISPWVVTLDALMPFESPLSERLVPEFKYLNHPTNRAHDIHLSVVIETADEKIPVADKIRATDFYWSMPQLLVHQTISGCNVNVGDLIATGTCSGETDVSGEATPFRWKFTLLMLECRITGLAGLAG
jgi:fumarylacetoacetase